MCSIVKMISDTDMRICVITIFLEYWYSVLKGLAHAKIIKNR